MQLNIYLGIENNFNPGKDYCGICDKTKFTRAEMRENR